MSSGGSPIKQPQHLYAVLAPRSTAKTAPDSSTLPQVPPAAWLRLPAPACLQALTGRAWC